MKALLILDTETSSLDPTTGHLLEVAVAVWSIEHRSLIRARSWLVRAPSNEAVDINGIPEALLSLGANRDEVMSEVYEASKVCDVVVAHNAPFDWKWFTPEIQSLAWADSCNDMEWPRPSSSRGLTALALAHGLGVASAHRALDDVMTLVRLFERAAELGANIEAMVQRALRPKALFQAMVSFEDRELAKAARFRWNEDGTKRWLRSMPPDDTTDLGFKVQQVDDASGEKGTT